MNSKDIEHMIATGREGGLHEAFNRMLRVSSSGAYQPSVNIHSPEEFFATLDRLCVALAESPAMMMPSLTTFLGIDGKTYADAVAYLRSDALAVRALRKRLSEEMERRARRRPALIGAAAGRVS